MDLKDMQYFCTIVEEGQISKAAKKLNISQPPLSLRLKELENELGCTLIHRNAGQWKISAEGQELYKRSQQILTHIAGLGESIKKIGSSCSGTVKIGIGAHCVSFFQKIFPKLVEKYPKISCRTVVADSPTVEKYLQDRSIELAIVRLNIENNNCTTYNLTPQKMVAVYSDLLKVPAETSPVTFKELVKYPLLFSRRWANADGFRPIIAAFQKDHLTPHITLDTQLPSLIFELLYTTPAVAIMPDSEIPTYRTHNFLIRPIEHFVVFQPALAYLNDAYLTPQAMAVIDLIKEMNPLTP